MSAHLEFDQETLRITLLQLDFYMKFVPLHQQCPILVLILTTLREYAEWAKGGPHQNTVDRTSGLGASSWLYDGWQNQLCVRNDRGCRSLVIVYIQIWIWCDQGGNLSGLSQEKKSGGHMGMRPWLDLISILYWRFVHTWSYAITAELLNFILIEYQLVLGRHLESVVSVAFPLHFPEVKILVEV